MCKVSIIVPNFNHAKYLPQRLNSIFNQTYQDFEVILLDDCSTDNSLEILEQYRNHPKVKASIFNKKNSCSTFKQWEIGINQAKGEFIWIAESDDWCEPTLLETLVESLIKYTKISLGYVQSYYMVGNIIKYISNQNELERVISGKEYIKNGNAIFNASMAIFRKSAFDKIGNEYTNFKFCGDWLFWYEIASQGDVFISGKILNYFRKHSEDVSGKAYASGLSYIEELNVLFILHAKNMISKDEFFVLLNSMHLNYKSLKSKFSTQKRVEIDYLFYSNEYTKEFKNKLLMNSKKRYLKQKYNSIINKLFIWK